jgi:hypothetical protein
MEFWASAGEKINGASWVIRDLWDVSRPNGKGLITIPKKLKSTGIKRLVERALYAQGIRQKLPPHKDVTISKLITDSESGLKRGAS